MRLWRALVEFVKPGPPTFCPHCGHWWQLVGVPHDTAKCEMIKMRKQLEELSEQVATLGVVTIEEITPEVEARVREQFRRAAAEHTFDATDETPDTDEFGRIQSHYWVLSYKGEEADVGWVMSAGRPIDVPNGGMIWRRPTYGEFLRWKEWWSEHGQPRTTSDRTKRYSRSPHDIPLCECGHGEDSHSTSGMLLFLCQMSCDCRSFRKVEEPS